MEAVKFENVYFSYDDDDENSRYVLSALDLSVEKGEFLAVLGHNGSGKSTLAKLVNGLLTPVKGKITVLGMEVADDNLFEIRKKVGLVFQNPDNQTVASIVEDDIAFGPENIGVKSSEISERIDFALSMVGMEEYKRSTTDKLSGGQKQRIAIAGVLALKPEIMILDESTAMLDPKGRKEVIDVVKKLNKEENITIILITHFPEEALQADRAIVMGDNHIVMEGNPEEILRRGDELEENMLTLPRSVKLCRELTKGGVTVCDTLDAEVLAKEIAKVLPPCNSDKISDKEEKDYSDGLGSIRAENLHFTYDANSPFSTQALCGVDLKINAGEFFGILGHTGSGKSTFVQHLNALIKLPTAEKKYKKSKKYPLPEMALNVNGVDIGDKKTNFREFRKHIGMVFQYPEYQLFAETVFDDVAFGYKNFVDNYTDEELKNTVKEALETVGLNYEEVKDRSPFELSGGQKRRVAIAGVIVTKPEILVLDEPAAGLDPKGKETVMKLLHDLHGKWCKTVIIVSHDMDEISENCTKAAVFSDGKVVCEGTPKEIFANSDKLFELGLDIPFTAKVTKKLEEYGIKVASDLTNKDFAENIINLYKKVGGSDA